MTQRQRYTKEFKREAVRLLESGESPGVEIARELGIKRNQLYKWREELKDKGPSAFAGPGRRPLDPSDKLAQLERENTRLKQEVEILKKAAAYFAREVE